MDFQYHYTDEQESFRKEVREWLAKSIPDNMKSPVDPLALSEEQYHFWRDMHQQLSAKGWLHPT